MVSFKVTVFSTLAFVVIFTTLPTAIQCDSSYHEKYHAAHRFLLLERISLQQHDFAVEFSQADKVDTFESVWLVGDIEELGAWAPEAAIRMNRSASEHNVWTATAELPANTSISYRYFIAALDNETGTLQIRRWESSLQARAFNTTAIASQRPTDMFGRSMQSQQTSEVQRGWLHRHGRIVQFKLFTNPISFVEKPAANVRIYVKLQPVESRMLTPILPSARANAEYVRMRYGDSFIRAQPEFGVPYEDSDIIIFHTNVAQLNGVAYLLKLYSTQEGSDLVSFLGYQYIYPDVLQGSEGGFSVNLISPTWLNVIASIDIKYLVIAPLPNDTVDFRTSFVDYWRANWTQLDVGHRGLGKSLQVTSNAPPITENTVASMKAAGELGAEMVEFDVMLTKDLVPIIAHDYSVYVSNVTGTPTSRSDLKQLLIKDVTYEELKNYTTYQVFGLLGNTLIEYPAHNDVKEVDQRLFPLFEDFLTQVNLSVGFDIEIKWPQQIRLTGGYESEQTIDKNVFIDRILEVMLHHGCGRLSFFTSFDADICTLLRFKQNMYPVMFLSSGGVSIYADPRTRSIYDTVNNAQAFDLAGIVPNAVAIQSDPSLIEVAHRQHKKIFLWGDSLRDTESIAWFKNTGPEGVIYDRVDLRVPSDKQNAFELESDLPEFFKLQCSMRNNTTLNDIDWY